MISICTNKRNCIRTFLLVSFVQLSTIFSFGNDTDKKAAKGKAKVANVAPVMPLLGEHTESGNQVEWMATSENVKFYIVQRSEDGVKFKPLAVVQKQGDLDNYSFVDTKAGNKTWFYRIVQVGHSGKGSYTGTVFLN